MHKFVRKVTPRLRMKVSQRILIVRMVTQPYLQMRGPEVRWGGSAISSSKESYEGIAANINKETRNVDRKDRRKIKR